jgi:hypothetical protein
MLVDNFWLAPRVVSGLIRAISNKPTICLIDPLSSVICLLLTVSLNHRFTDSLTH